MASTFVSVSVMTGLVPRAIQLGHFSFWDEVVFGHVNAKRLFGRQLEAFLCGVQGNESFTGGDVLHLKMP